MIGQQPCSPQQSGSATETVNGRLGRVFWTILTYLRTRTAKKITGITFSILVLVIVPSYWPSAVSDFFLDLGNVWLVRASMYHETGADQNERSSLREASNYLRRALDWDPSSASAYRGLGRAYAAEGAHEKAIYAFHRSAEIYPNLLTYAALGDAYQAVGQQELAIASWAQGGGELAHFHVLLGQEHFRQGTFNQAEVELGIALQIGGLTDEDKVWAFQALSEICHNRGQLDEAIVWLQRAIEIAPDRASIYDALGLTLLQAGEVGDAIAAANKAIALDPTLPGPHSTLAAAYVDKGMLEQAIDEYTCAVSLAPDDVWAHYGFGVAYWRMGDSERAIAEWRTALTIDPNFEPARRCLDGDVPVP